MEAASNQFLENLQSYIDMPSFLFYLRYSTELK